MAKEIENTMVNNNVYILTDINQQTTNGLLAQLSQWVEKAPFSVCDNPDKKEQDITDDTVYVIGGYKIYKPYEPIPENTSVLNVYINSFGGKTSVMLSILSMFNIAHAKGTIIRTYNMSNAESSASMIAISGTKGYRYMAHNATNYIHYGSFSKTTNHTDEIEIAKKDLEKFKDTTTQIYLDNTNLTKKEMRKYYNTEGAGSLDAIQCLDKQLCDWVITPKGWTNKIEDLKQLTR